MRYVHKILPVLFSILLMSVALSSNLKAQPVPGENENIYSLVTFGKNGETSWGDDDFSQTWFFVIPKDYKGKFYIRIFDPDTGGEWDEGKGDWNTKMQYSLYGGKGVDPEKSENEDSRGINPTGNYKSGKLMKQQVVGNEKKYDGGYLTLGPFNPAEGDFSTKRGGYIFKLICDGISGDDGNLYKYFLSSSPSSDIAIPGANAFTYEYTFRMWNYPGYVANIYPYIDTGTVSIEVSNFDWDNDGQIVIISRVRKGTIIKKMSTQNNWEKEVVPVDEREIGVSLDFQFIKNPDLVRNNNVVVRLQNQRGDNIKFFSSPIGGVPVYNADWKEPKKIQPPPKK